MPKLAFVCLNSMAETEFTLRVFWKASVFGRIQWAVASVPPIQHEAEFESSETDQRRSGRDADFGNVNPHQSCTDQSASGPV